jgi:hypothetical protein
MLFSERSLVHAEFVGEEGEGGERRSEAYPEPGVIKVTHPVSTALV